MFTNVQLLERAHSAIELNRIVEIADTEYKMADFEGVIMNVNINQPDLASYETWE